MQVMRLTWGPLASLPTIGTRTSTLLKCEYLPPAYLCLQVIAFNLGSLGFLTNHWHENFREDLDNIIFGCKNVGEIWKRHASPARIWVCFEQG